MNRTLRDVMASLYNLYPFIVNMVWLVEERLRCFNKVTQRVSTSIFGATTKRSASWHQSTLPPSAKPRISNDTWTATTQIKQLSEALMSIECIKEFPESVIGLLMQYISDECRECHRTIYHCESVTKACSVNRNE